MQGYAKFVLLSAVLLVSIGLCAQEVYPVHDADLLARLSYDSSPIVQGEGVQHICVAVYQGGDYRIVRSVNAQTLRLQGKMSKEQFQQLQTLLGRSEFRSLSGNHGRLIRKEAESFAAEIPVPGLQREDGAQRFQWLNADGQSPLPGSVARVVDWLKTFEPTDGKSIVYSGEYLGVCPSGRLHSLQPSADANQRP
jgi:hypothetical protein